VEGKVVEVEEGKLLAYSWLDDEDGQPSLVVWRLDPDDEGTKLTLEHRLIEEPVVNCLGIDTYFNWDYALRNSLPGLLMLLSKLGGRVPRPPIVYVDETSGTESKERVSR
jgi:hypothetical protein